MCFRHAVYFLELGNYYNIRISFIKVTQRHYFFYLFYSFDCFVLAYSVSFVENLKKKQSH